MESPIWSLPQPNPFPSKLLHTCACPKLNLFLLSQMALTPRPQLLHFHLRSPANPTPAPASLFLSFPISPPSLSKNDFLSAFSPVTVKLSLRTKCLRSATEEDRLSESETLSDDEAADNGDAKIQHLDNSTTAAAAAASSSSSAASTGSMRVATTSSSSYGDSLSLGIREPVYEVCFICNLLHQFSG